jgi:hypothetical protein
MKSRTVAAVAVLATAACQHVTGPSPSATTVAPTSTHTATQVGPHSALADVELPEGSTLLSTTTATGSPDNVQEIDEHWHYVVNYDDAVQAMNSQLGRSIRMPKGQWINRCTPVLVDSHYHAWTYAGNLESIQVMVNTNASITISHQVPVTLTVMGCTPGAAEEGGG